jgi:hypothetical protein
MKRLPFHVSLVAEETPASYASRLAVCNGYDFSKDFCLDLGMSLQDIANGELEALSKLSVLGGVSLCALHRNAIERLDKGVYTVAGEAFNQRWINVSKLRFCPDCALEDLSHPERHGFVQRAKWVIPFIRTCNIHNKALINVNPESHTRGYHDYSGRLRDLGVKTIQNHSEGASAPSTKLELYLSNRLEGECVNSWIDSLNCNTIGCASEALGILLTFGPKALPGKLSQSELSLATDAGFECIAKGRVNILQRLEKHRLNLNYTHYYGRGTYGYFYNWLEQSHSDLFDGMRDIMREHIIHNYPIGYGDVVLGKQCRKRILHSIKTATEEINILPRTLEEIIKVNGIHPVAPDVTVGNPVSLFRASDINPLLKKFRSSISQLDAQRRMNMGRAQFNVLQKEGYFSPIGGGSARRPLYDPVQLDAFIGKLIKNALRIERPNANQVNIQTACRKVVAGAVEIVQLILDEKLDFVGKKSDEVGYSAILVDPSEVLQNLELSELQGHLKSELYDLLGVNAATIDFLVRNGYFSLKSSRHPKSRKAIQIVPFHEMAAFLRLYTSCRQLALTHGVDTGTLGRKLDELSIYPLKMQIGCKGRIYSKADIT